MAHHLATLELGFRERLGACRVSIRFQGRQVQAQKGERRDDQGSGETGGQEDRDSGLVHRNEGQCAERSC